ncbi:Acg family FMN-binding oxidoreductase [Pseudonocardia sp. CA-107938]|uniref:Acg family FMN-binding oxidoreductase n=1 Tax=Pseudonocardia sp. CA-107938 TaxID=3240021 RepID=UPI003D8F5541
MIEDRVDEQTVRSALALASRAPSVHNSQPWLWRYDERTVHLVADMRRWLPATDAVGRDMVVSCGAALHHLRVALAASGVAASVRRMPDPDAPDLLAALVLRTRPASDADLRAAAMIIRRRTDRRRYGDWTVPPGFLAELAARAAAEGVVARPVDEAGGRTAVVEAVRAAAQEQLFTDRFATETALWTGRLAGDDGIPPANLLADPAGTGDGLARPFPGGTIVQDPGSDGAALMVLGTTSDDPLSQLRAGEALSSMLLHATDLGLATCPLTQPLEVESTRRALRDDLLGGHLAPQAILRVGWAPHEPLPPTPRRPLADVIERIRR